MAFRQPVRFDDLYSDLFARRGLSLDRLRAFLAVAEAGSIARVAPNQATRQSQLSRQIGELEDYFGHPLLERRGRGFVLTAAGERLAATVRETFAGLREVAAHAAAQPVTATLGAGDSLLHGWLIPALPPVAASLVVVALDGPDVALRLRDARIDLGVMRATEAGRDLRTRSLGTVALALYVPRALDAPGATVERILATTPIAARPADPETARVLAGPPALACETFTQVQRAVATGRFAGILPTLARRELAPPDYRELALSLPQRRIVLAWHRRLERQRPRVAALIGELAQAFAGALGPRG
jgi:DNA-binding transcriptional LysR family regulator